MRIVLLLNARFPTEKAYGIQTLTMAEGYAALGHAVAIAYPRRTKEIPQPMPGVVFIPYGHERELRIPGLFQLFRLFGAWSAASALSQLKPDVVIANDPLQAVFVAKTYPTLWELHDLPAPTRWSRRMLLTLLARRVAGIVSTNQLKLDALQLVVGKLPPTIVMPNAVTFDPAIYRQIDRHAARRELGIPEDEKVIVYAGQLFDWKGVDTLIAAAEYLPKNVRIHLIGGIGKDLERCQKLAARISNVTLHGQKPKEEIPKWLRAASIVVIPNSGKFEVAVRDTNPLKLFEAFAAGAAIVASDLPSIREAVGGNTGVRFVVADHPQKLAEAIMESLNHVSVMRSASELVHPLSALERAASVVTFFSQLPKQGHPSTV